LSLTIRASAIAPAYCPRCLVRRREAVEFVRTERAPAAGGRANRSPAK